jgi:RNA polymerase sigma factor (sigma-70 family)
LLFGSAFVIRRGTIRRLDGLRSMRRRTTLQWGFAVGVESNADEISCRGWTHGDIGLKINSITDYGFGERSRPNNRGWPHGVSRLRYGRMDKVTSNENPSGDRGLIESLARKHMPAVRRYFRRKGFDHADCEDATQEVFMRLAQRKGVASEVDRFDSYLFATAASVAIDMRRRARVRAAGLHDTYDEALHADVDYGPEELLDGREALAIMVRALKELPMRTRIIFVLARLEHMKQAEIAARLGVSLNTVEKNLHKAIAYLGERVRT